MDRVGAEMSETMQAANPGITSGWKPWTLAEERVLRQHYVDGGVEECLERLPHRSIASIYGRARHLGLKTQVKFTERKQWPNSEHIDNAIREVYQSTPTKGGVLALAGRLMRPRWWVSKRARDLGLTVPRFKEPEWCAAEEELLAINAHKSLCRIAHIFRRNGYTRTAVAIGIRRKRLQLGPRLNPDPDRSPANHVAKLMGVDPKTVTRWIEMEGLPAKRAGTKRTPQQGGDMWHINMKDLRAWVADHAVQVDLRKVDRFWFIDLMMGRYR